VNPLPMKRLINSTICLIALNAGVVLHASNLIPFPIPTSPVCKLVGNATASKSGVISKSVFSLNPESKINN
jgi:hypothetical protein